MEQLRSHPIRKHVLAILILLVTFSALSNSFAQSEWGQDTVLVDCGLKASMYSISQAEYSSKKDNSKKTLANGIKKENGSIELLLSNNKRLVIKDTLVGEGDPMQAEYLYKGMYADEGFHLIHGGYYETSGSLLIYRNDGKIYWMFGDVCLSPSGRFFVNYSGVFGSGLVQIRLNDNGILKLIYSYDQEVLWNNDNRYNELWIPQGVKWIDSNTIYFIKKDYPDGEKDEYGAIKLSLKSIK